MYLKPQLSAVLQRRKLLILFPDKQSDRDILFNGGLEGDLPRLEIARQIPVRILLEPFLLQVLGEMKQRAKRATARVVAHVDGKAVAIVIRTNFFDVGIKNGTHERQCVTELYLAAVDAPVRTEDLPHVKQRFRLLDNLHLL